MPTKTLACAGCSSKPCGRAASGPPTLRRHRPGPNSLGAAAGYGDRGGCHSQSMRPNLGRAVSWLMGPWWRKSSGSRRGRRGWRPFRPPLRTSFALGKLGRIWPSEGMYRFAPGLIRLPDITFVSPEKYRQWRKSKPTIADFGPDLAVEVLSKSNRRGELERRRKSICRRSHVGVGGKPAPSIRHYLHESHDSTKARCQRHPHRRTGFARLFPPSRRIVRRPAWRLTILRRPEIDSGLSWEQNCHPSVPRPRSRRCPSWCISLRPMPLPSRLPAKGESTPIRCRWRLRRCRVTNYWANLVAAAWASSPAPKCASPA